MSKQSHTPGPWRLNGFGHIHNDSDEFVATLEHPVTKRTDDNWAANGRLIAAAPEMIEALEVAQEAFRNIDSDVLGGADRREIEKAEAYIQDALAKARGES